MRHKYGMLAIIVGLVLVVAAGWQVSMAQEADYILAHDDVFGDLRRPEVSFPINTTKKALMMAAAAHVITRRTTKPANSPTSKEMSAAAKNATI